MTATIASGFGQLLRTRRTIHRFRPDPLPEAALARALEAATFAPNHGLTQPWRFYLPGPETAAGLVELNTRLVAASAGPERAAEKAALWRAVPRWLALTCQRSEDPLRAREDYAACACAAQNLALSLWSEGIGMKWTTGPVTRTPEFHELMWIDAGAEEVVGLMMLGYPEEVPASSRRPVAECMLRLP
jgi:nitroreductase